MSPRPMVAVFCSSQCTDKDNLTLARQVGESLAKAGYSLVWGGCHDGMMGAIADGFRECGGELHAVIPASFIASGRAYEAAHSRDECENLAHRKTRMMELAQAFVILPGGIGTLDELFTVLAESVLQVSRGGEAKPVFIYDPFMIYLALHDLVDELFSADYIRVRPNSLYAKPTNIDELIAMLKSRVPVS